MKNQKIITIHLIDENNQPVICPQTNKPSSINLDEDVYLKLLEKAKSIYPEGLSEQDYIEKIANACLKKELNEK